MELPKKSVFFYKQAQRFLIFGLLSCGSFLLKQLLTNHILKHIKKRTFSMFGCREFN